MEKYNNLEKEWIKSLDSGDPGRILAGLYQIRNSGSVRILPLVCDLINAKTPPVVRNEIFQLLGELKQQEAVPLLVESIQKHDFGEYLPAFIGACWQSGLDFSNYLQVFARLFIHEDYITSLEAFTVIEESFPNADDPERDECLHYLKESEYLIADEKTTLFRELMKVVQGS